MGPASGVARGVVLTTSNNDAREGCSAQRGSSPQQRDRRDRLRRSITLRMRRAICNRSLGCALVGAVREIERETTGAERRPFVLVVADVEDDVAVHASR